MVARYAKAIVAGLVAGLGSAATSLQNGGSFTAQNYIQAIIVGLVALSGVAFTPNKTT